MEQNGLACLSSIGSVILQIWQTSPLAVRGRYRAAPRHRPSSAAEVSSRLQIRLHAGVLRIFFGICLRLSHITELRLDIQLQAKDCRQIATATILMLL